MRTIGWIAGLALAAASAASGPAFAAKGKGRAADDPDREICKSQAVVGSRLKRIRTCMTAQQWADLKLQEKVGLGRQQINGNPGCDAGCSIDRGGKDTPW